MCFGGKISKQYDHQTFGKDKVCCYRAYGLRIDTALPLLDLISANGAESDGEADVTIRFGRLDGLHAMAG